jgi:hypothetical protein
MLVGSESGRASKRASKRAIERDIERARRPGGRQAHCSGLARALEAATRGADLHVLRPAQQAAERADHKVDAPLRVGRRAVEERREAAK